MRIRRFFIDIDDNKDKNDIIKPDKELSNRIFNVLRLKENNILELISKKQILSVKITSKNLLVENSYPLEENKFKRILAVSLIEKSRFDIIIEKVTELNITDIMPIITTRTKPFGKNAYNKQIKKWEKTSQQALSQSYRNSLLTIHEPKKFSHLLEDFEKTNFIKLLLSTKETDKKFDFKLYNKNIIVLIGPEGGFTEEEETLALEKYNFKPLSIARNILRAETACIAISTLLEFNSL